jgi:hypothetical protein
MTEKKFLVFATRTTEMTAVVYADSLSEARGIAEDSLEVDWEFGDQDDTITEVRVYDEEEEA